MEKVREAVFNVIQNRVCDKIFLDLFAGSGAVGIEALSRGARFCIFNDRSKKNAEIIAQNIHKCNLMERSKTFAMDSLKLLAHLKACEPSKMPVDVVYIDPPYKNDCYEQIINELANGGYLSDESILIVELPKGKPLSEKFGEFYCSKKSVYGDTEIWYFIK